MVSIDSKSKRIHCVKMNRLFLFCVLFVITVCSADDFVCRSINKNAKSLENYCQNFEGQIPINCSNELIELKSFNVTQLKNGGCVYDTVVRFIKEHQYIRDLDVSYSRYQNLDWLLDVQKLDQLQIFNASHNKIRNVPSGISNSLPSLTEIDLSYNQINAINHADSFKGAIKLSRIYLSDNFIPHISDNAFQDSPNLQYIDLKRNRINTVPAFTHNSNLRFVHLEENVILNFDCTNMYVPAQIEAMLFISWKNVKFFLGDENCNAKRIRVIPNSVYEGVYMTPNGKTEIHCKQQSFEYLRVFHSGRDSFDNIADILPCFGSNIEIIIFSDNAIRMFNTTALDRFALLQRLHLSGTMLTDFNIHGIKNHHRLLALDLSRNNLTSLDHVGLLLNLEEFDVGYNQLEDVSEMIEQLPDSLTYLDASGNVIGPINDSTFKRFTELQNLKLSNTTLSFASSNPFQANSNLLFLDISHNNLTDLNFTMLSETFNQLISINASECQIQHASEIIRHLKYVIAKIDVSGNFIGNFDANIFKWFIYLEELNLSNTSISDFDPAILESLTELNILDLSYNKLQTIDLESMTDKLNWINLQGNELKKIDRFAPKTSHNISLGIEGNYLPCVYIKKIKNDFPNIQFIDDPLNQKHGQDCQSTSQAINEFLGSVYTKVKFW